MITTIILAQESENPQVIEYTPGFTFQDGLYLNVEMVKANQPVPFYRIVTDHNKYDKGFFDDLIAQENIIFYDDNGVETSILIKDSWGYSLNGRLYLMLGSKFQEIYIQGAISLFIASATTTEEIILVQEYDYRIRKIISNVTAKNKKYLFDFESNELKGYHYEYFEEMLRRDSELYAEYTSLPRRKKNRLMLTFIRRYNEKHPLYFPVN